MIRYKTVSGCIFPEYHGFPVEFDQKLNETVKAGWEFVKFEIVPNPNYYSDTKAVALFRKDIED